MSTVYHFYSPKIFFLRNCPIIPELFFMLWGSYYSGNYSSIFCTSLIKAFGKTWQNITVLLRMEVATALDNVLSVSYNNFGPGAQKGTSFSLQNTCQARWTHRQCRGVQGSERLLWLKTQPVHCPTNSDSYGPTRHGLVCISSHKTASLFL